MNRITAVLVSFSIVGALVIILPTLSTEVRATTLHVGGSGGGNYTDIQTAIDAAFDGDSVIVYSGTYLENIEIDKRLELISEVDGAAIIDGEGGDAIHVNSSFVRISGFAIINSDLGIRLYGASHCVIENNTISDGDIGIYLSPVSPLYSDNNTILNNQVSNVRLGMTIARAHNNSIINNIITDIRATGISMGAGRDNLIQDNALHNISTVAMQLSGAFNITLTGNVMSGAGILFGAYTLEEWTSHSIDTSNTVNGNPIQYWKNVAGGTVPQGAGEIILANCTGIVVENQVLIRSTMGIQLGYSSDNIISNNTVSLESFIGIELLYSDNNTLNHNSVTASLYGISMAWSDNNVILNNMVHSSKSESFHIYDADSNRFYHNNILEPFWTVFESQSLNQWDDGYPSGGNYWLEYEGVDDCSGPNQNICPDPDGIGDTPVGTNPGDDRYPLMDLHLPLARSPPFSPQNLTASPGNQSVTLTWDPPEFEGSSPVTNYRVYRGTTTGWKTLVDEIGNVLTYEDTGLVNGQKYYYEVTTVNAVGESKESEEASATPASAPSPPRNLTAQSGDGEVVLTWEAPVDDGGYPVQSYFIYRGTSSGAETFLIEIGNILTFVDDDDLRGGQTYHYRVAARNYIGEGLKSNEAIATLSNHPPTCSIARPEPGNTVSGRFNISGSASDSDGEIEYVDVRIDDGAWFQVIGTDSWYYRWDTTEVSNGEHTISVRAFDGSNYSEEVSLTAEVDNPDSLILWLLILTVATIMIFVVVLYFFLARRRKEEGEEIDHEQQP
jgi:parallel beta-helix repeat protein